MWGGDTNGFAWLKFSGSPKIRGFSMQIMINVRMDSLNVIESLAENDGWNWILSIFRGKLDGFVDPEVWSEIKWIKIMADRINGSRKWKEKNRFKVGLFTEKSPHTHLTISIPTSGITDMRFVITVVPQNDICPHGKTYPTNAVPIKINKIVIPLIHVSVSLNEE